MVRNTGKRVMNCMQSSCIFNHLSFLEKQASNLFFFYQWKWNYDYEPKIKVIFTIQIVPNLRADTGSVRLLDTLPWSQETVNCNFSVMNTQVDCQFRQILGKPGYTPRQVNVLGNKGLKSVSVRVDSEQNKDKSNATTLNLCEPHFLSQETTTNNSSQKRDVISASVSDLEQPDADVKTTLRS